MRVVITGPKQSGRATMAACALQRLGWIGAQADTDLIEDHDWPEIFLRIQRFARWAGLALIWRGTRLDRPWPPAVEPSPVQIIVRERDQKIASRDGTVDHFIEQPRLSLSDRKRLWQENYPGFASWDVAEQRRLAGSYRLHAGHIVAIGTRGAATAGEAAELAREATRSDLGELGQLLPCSFRWDDIVLKPQTLAALRDLAYEAQERAEFWENPEARRLFPRGTGLSALFTGDPGGGKTMAAEIIAADLELDLYRIDLARSSANTSARPRRTCAQSSTRRRESARSCSSTRRTRCSASAPRSRTATTATPTCGRATCFSAWRTIAAWPSSRRTSAATGPRVLSPPALRI